MKYGSLTEPQARQCYAEMTNSKVVRLGLIINPVAPWLGYSPDGYVIEKNKIIEIKCPVLGKTEKMCNVLPTLKYLEKGTAAEYTLRKKHEYYCQIQIGWTIESIWCDLLNRIYSIYKK